jgi:hypothetical protein
MEEIEQLYSVFRHVLLQKHTKQPLMILNQPIEKMLGALKYPKENERFHKLFGISEDECLIACKSLSFIS